MQKFYESLVSQVIYQNTSVNLSKNDLEILKSIPSEVKIPLLKSIFFTERNNVVTSRSFDAILSTDNFDGVGFLIELIETTSNGWPEASCRRLADYKDIRAVEVLCKILSESGDADLRFIAAESLGVNGDTSAIATLEHSMKNDKGEDYETFPISEAAKNALEKIKSRNSE